jgi:hypothetical protein
MDIQKKDFFISYTSSDKGWAIWIDFVLQKAQYSTIVQVYDFQPGGNFIADMHQALINSERLILVLSAKYLKSLCCQAEWQNIFANDPIGERALIIPVRVEDIKPTGLLTARTYIDLVGKNEQEAEQALLSGLSSNPRPANLPSFPGVR